MMSNNQLKLVSLVVLTVQTSAFVLVARRSRIPDERGTVYFAGTAVLLMELTKLITSAIMIVFRALKNSTREKQIDGYQALNSDELASQPSSPSRSNAADKPAISVVHAFAEIKELLWTPSALWLAVPAASYVAQNNLQLLAATYLEPALFQTFTQAKLITTAFFSVLIMKRSLHKYQWLSILLLAFGLAVVHQTAEVRTGASASGSGGESGSSNVTMGFIMMMGAALLSGFAGVFTERVLKQDKDFWATNFHMSSFSLLPAFGVIAAEYIRQPSFEMMRSFGSWAWATVLLNAFGGLIVSMVLKYADSVAKGFSLACAVILTVFVNVFFFGAFFTFNCLFGILTVLLSTTLYIAVGTMLKKQSAPSNPPTPLSHTLALSPSDDAQSHDREKQYGRS